MCSLLSLSQGGVRQGRADATDTEHVTLTPLVQEAPEDSVLVCCYIPPCQDGNPPHGIHADPVEAAQMQRISWK